MSQEADQRMNTGIYRPQDPENPISFKFHTATAPGDQKIYPTIAKEMVATCSDSGVVSNQIANYENAFKKYDHGKVGDGK